jgi:sugar lactone lactonase YvrE
MTRRLQSSRVNRAALGSVCCLAAISLTSVVLGAEQLFDSQRFTPPKEYTSGIEGPAVNAAGDLFVVNIRRPDTPNPDRKGVIGVLRKGAAKSTVFKVLPSRVASDGTTVRGIGNGIRFDLQGRMYVADYKLNTIHAFEPDSTRRDYFVALPNNQGKPAFNQPNDLAIARDGTLYASDPNMTAGTGQIWQITRGSDGLGRGKPMTSTRTMGKTNGIDLSPDNKTLYVSESSFNGEHPKRPASVWSYRIDGTTLVDPVAVKTFTDGFDVDGLRVDTDGRIFVARPEAKQVVILVPPGSVGAAHDPVETTGQNPNNLTFGGADGRDVYVTQGEDNKRYVERFRTDRPGREPCLLTPPPPDCRPVPQ